MSPAKNPVANPPSRSQSGVTAPGAPRWQTATFCALIFAVAFIVYQPALRGDFLWDDAGHVTRPDLRSLAGLGRIWCEIGATQQYYPMLHSAFWIEHRLWGDSVLGYHFLNVVLHATAACLFAFVLRRVIQSRNREAERVPPSGPVSGFSRTTAWFAALLFVLHPVCVESVAWISEQKNTLSAVFYLSAGFVYLCFDAGRTCAEPAGNCTAGKTGWGAYALATSLFVVALLTKTVTATLPAALLVVFWWQRGALSWRRDVVPLLPWFVIAVAGGLFTAHFERQLIGAQGSDFSLGIVERGLLAGRVFWFYLGKLVWPANLIFIYPRWTVDASQLVTWTYSLVATALPVALILIAANSAEPQRSRMRTILAALLLFGGTLVPVLGFFNIYPFLFSYVADHFQYLASLPIFALAAAGMATAREHFEEGAGPAARLSIRYVGYGVAGLLLTVLATRTWRQAGIYRDGQTLYATTLTRNPNCWMAHNNLAINLANEGRVAEAIPHLETALALKPDFAQAENNLGDDLVRVGRVGEAIPHFEHAIRLQPKYAVAHRNLGLALAMTNRTDEAVAHFAQAVELEPAFAEAEVDWAMALAQTREFSLAIRHFEHAIAVAPNSIDAQVGYADALVAHGDFQAAVEHYRAALELAPESADAHRGLAYALRHLGRIDEAQEHDAAAQRLGVARP